MTEADIARFWAKVAPPNENGCRLWTGGLHGKKKANQRYGTFWLDGKMVKAHRVAYIIARGEVPAGMQVLHTCDVTQCVEENHIYAGTHDRNMKDKADRGRVYRPSGSKHHSVTKPECVAHGEDHGNAKLSNAQVLEIRGMKGKITANLCGELYEVSGSTVHLIWRGKTWQRV